MENKGFVTWFLNINEDNKHVSVDDYINLVRKHNQETIDSLAKSGYPSMFIPCYKEACRVEKTNFIKEKEEDEESEE